MGIDELREYLRADESDDSTIISLQGAAEIFLTGQGVNSNYSSELYKLAVKMLASHWFNNREAVGKADKLAFGLEAITFNLKYNQVTT